MTEIINLLKKYTDGKQNTDKVEISVLQLNRVIKALEQETVSKKSYDHEFFLRKEFELKIDELQRQLDKIRAEIMSKDGLEEALEIIDKY